MLKKFLERGGGLLVVSGDRATWPQGEADLLPGRFGATVDRTTGRSGSLGYLDYSHPVFEVFKAPRSGDFSAAHVFRYRALQTTPADRVLARYDDGAVAAAEKKIGGGRAIVWTTTLDDSWTDIAREAGVPAAGASARPLPGALRAADLMAHGRTGPRSDRARERTG